MPEPAVQSPPFMLYSQVAPPSRPVTLTVPLLVLPSLELEPVSWANAMLSEVEGAVLSIAFKFTVVTLEVLPAASVAVAVTVTRSVPVKLPVLAL